MESKDILSKLSNKIVALRYTNIFIIGDIILDTYISGKVSRISPEAPVPVLHEKNKRFVLGGAGNVAANIACFDAKAFLCGRVGSDQEGEQLLKLTRHFGIDTSACLISNIVPTIQKTRVIAGSQQLLRIDNELYSELSSDEENFVIRNLHEFSKLSGNKAIVISDYGKGFITKQLLNKVINYCCINDIPVITDPKSNDLVRYTGSTVIKPNLKEGKKAFTNLHLDKKFDSFFQEVQAIGNAYLETSLAKNIVMSLSEHGVMVKGEDCPQTLILESHAIEVADVSGAGDTMIAFLAMGLAAKHSLEVSARYANVAAGIVCSKLGTATVNYSEFISKLLLDNKIGSFEKKIISTSEIEIICKKLQSENKTIVFTNGCFDILHSGHVKYLNEAKLLGNILIVGLNSDESISRLKGPTRPIQTFMDRATILASLSFVDFIVEFTEDTPLNLIKTIEPNVLVKGGDWQINSIVGASEVQNKGGIVKTIQFIDGKSTTNIVKKAIESSKINS